MLAALSSKRPGPRCAMRSGLFILLVQPTRVVSAETQSSSRDWLRDIVSAKVCTAEFAHATDPTAACIASPQKCRICRPNIPVPKSHAPKIGHALNIDCPLAVQ
jgi:hypothetical protein